MVNVAWEDLLLVILGDILPCENVPQLALLLQMCLAGNASCSTRSPSP